MTGSVPVRGSQYASNDFRAAFSGSFLATLEAEEISAPYETTQHAHRGIGGYFQGFYNPLRSHSSVLSMNPSRAQSTAGAKIRRSSLAGQYVG
ncbi:MAG: hypothetical protein ACRESI_07670 [Gammaproteobacteria bacterium]